ncbi:MAG: hypothetical protein CMK56_08560 [Proteobacteria bacterium]|nr:hypothetical protein [Pseudomonadota bacterium]
MKEIILKFKRLPGIYAITPGTRWNDVPENWVCPECGARKEDFEVAEI